MCGVVCGVDVQEKVLTMQPADPRALGQPPHPSTLAPGFACAPAPCAWIVRHAAIARCDVRPPGGDRGAQQREETIDRIGFALML
jgi:hypothetical protein